MRRVYVRPNLRPLAVARRKTLKRLAVALRKLEAVREAAQAWGPIDAGYADGIRSCPRALAGALTSIPERRRHAAAVLMSNGQPWRRSVPPIHAERLMLFATCRLLIVASFTLALATFTNAQCDPQWLPGDPVAVPTGPLRQSLSWDPDGASPAA